MRVDLDNERKILGFYPEEIDYSTLPDPLVDITDAQYRAVLDGGHTHLDDEGNGYTPPAPTPPPPDLSRLTLREKLRNLGLTSTDIDTLIGDAV